MVRRRRGPRAHRAGDGHDLHREYTRPNRLPTVALCANPTSGLVPLTVGYTASAKPPGRPGLHLRVGPRHDGLYDDGTGATKQKQYASAGTRTVHVRVTDSHGGQDTDFKSMRGSDVDAAMHYLARMLTAGRTRASSPAA